MIIDKVNRLYDYRYLLQILCRRHAITPRHQRLVVKKLCNKAILHSLLPTLQYRMQVEQSKTIEKNTA